MRLPAPNVQSETIAHLKQGHVLVKELLKLGHEFQVLISHAFGSTPCWAFAATSPTSRTAAIISSDGGSPIVAIRRVPPRSAGNFIRLFLDLVQAFISFLCIVEFISTWA